MFNSKIGIGVLKHPGYNGKGGSTSTSTSIDFFGEGKRAPYEQLLSALLLGGTIGGTPGYYTGGTNRGGGGGGSNGGVRFSSAYDLMLQSHPFMNGAFEGKKNKNQGTYVPGTGGMSIGDYIKQTPGYQFQYGQGLEALNRNFAATGVGQTGAQDIALLNYGNQFAGQQLQQLISNVAGPAGVGMPLGQKTVSETTPGMGGIFGTIAGAAINKWG
jgi:hypothetical protein